MGDIKISTDFYHIHEESNTARTHKGSAGLLLLLLLLLLQNPLKGIETKKTILQCYHLAMLPLGSVTVWLCCSLAVKPFGYLAMWLPGCVAGLPLGHPAAWLIGRVAVLPVGCIAARMETLGSWLLATCPVAHGRVAA